MSFVSTTGGCELRVSGYTRKHYPNWSSVPVAIIALMSTFIDLWQRYRLTKDQLLKLHQVSDDISIVIPFTTVSIYNISFQLCISATLPAESSEVELEFVAERPDHIEFIGGYFYCCSRGFERQFIPYQRSIQDGEHVYLDDFRTIPLSECKTLSDLAFSIYFDVQQIKYAETVGIDNLDNFPPLKGYGECQVVIQEEDLTDLTNYVNIPFIVDTWTIHLHVDQQRKELEINPIQAFIPFDVLGFELVVKVRYTIKRKRNDTKYGLRTEAGRTRSDQRVHRCTCHYDHDSMGIVRTGIMAAEVWGASSIAMDIEWKIVSILSVPSDGYYWLNISHVDASNFGISMQDTDEE